MIINADKDSRIAEFLYSAPRFKIVVLRTDTFDSATPHVDIGKLVATYLKDNDLSMEAINEVKRFLASHIEMAIQEDAQFGKYICLTNIGIMFENQLDFSPVDFLSSISRNILVVLHWPGAIDAQKFYFLEKGSPYCIDLENINHIII